VRPSSLTTLSRSRSIPGVGKFVVAVFPDLANVSGIDSFRFRWDPLAPVLAPHITLVHPFEAALSVEDLRQHVVASVYGIKAFPVVLHGIVPHEDEYVWILIRDGADRLLDLRARLYSGPLSALRAIPDAYIPHVTLARVTSMARLRQALRSARTLRVPSSPAMVGAIAAYEILSTGARPTLFSTPLP
jgi:2'-5' RNA ligase